MDWKEKIIEGMKLIRKGCLENDNDSNCYAECPLAELCANTKVCYHPVFWDTYVDLGERYNPIYLEDE